MTQEKPPIDKTAEDAVLPDNPETSLVDVAENHPGYVYKPQQGVVSTDVLEVTLMMVLQLFANHIEVAPGALRLQIMTAERFGKLSPEAQRHMRPMAPEVPTA